MSLRNRTFIIIISASMIIVALGIIHGHLVFLNDYIDLETADIKANVIDIRNTLDLKLDDLYAITNDWSAWDDTYQFIEDKNDIYIESNLVDGTFENLGLDLIVYFDNDGQIIYEKAYDLEEGQEIPVCTEIHDFFRNNPDLFSIGDDDRISGFTSYNGNLLLLSLSPILTSSDEGPGKGYLLFAKQNY